METSVMIHAHARLRMEERGVTEADINEAVRSGEMFPAKHGRVGFRCNFSFEKEWAGVYYPNKQVEVICAEDPHALVVVTVIARYY